MKWLCRLTFVEPFVGKVPKDPDKLVWVMRRRVKEGLTPPLKEGDVEAESEEVYESQENTFYSDESGLYVKPIDIIGMLKERARQLGFTQRRGYVSALEGLRIDPIHIYLMRGGKRIKEVDGTVGKPIHKQFGVPTISLCDYVNPPCELEFTIEKGFDFIRIGRERMLTDDEFEELLRGCFKLGGLRKEYGRFVWVKVTKKR